MKNGKKTKRVAYKHSQSKVLVLEAQIRAMLSRELTEYHCPFCDLVTGQEQGFCCEKAADVINAVLDHVEFLQARDVADEIMDKVSGMQTPSGIFLN